MIVVADKTLSTYYPHYDERNHRNDSGFSKTYRDFIQEMQSNDQAKKDSLKYFIRGMFRKAYGVSFSDSSSIISQIKRTVPFYSTKVEKNYKGKGYISKMVNSRNRINKKIIFLHVSNTEEICDLMHSFLD